jgi:hypothetical protein
MSITTEQFEKQLSLLPFKLLMAVADSDMVEKINLLAINFELSPEKEETLSEEIGLVLLGLSNPNDFIRKLKNSLDISPEQAKLIADEVNTEIFQPVREDLLAFYKIQGNSLQNEALKDGNTVPIKKVRPNQFEEQAPNPNHDPQKAPTREHILNIIENPRKLSPLQQAQIEEKRNQSSFNSSRQVEIRPNLIPETLPIRPKNSSGSANSSSSPTYRQNPQISDAKNPSAFEKIPTIRTLQDDLKADGKEDAGEMPTPLDSLVDRKINGIVSIPKQEVRKDASDGTIKADPLKPIDYKSNYESDPYRETF